MGAVLLMAVLNLCLTGKLVAQTASADGAPEWSALLEVGIANPGGASGSITFPDQGTSTYTGSFDNEWLGASSRSVATPWQGSVGFEVEGSASVEESFFQVSGSRLTEGADLDVGAVAHNSGMFYEAIGRGSFVFTNGNSGNVSTWTISLDFSSLTNGYLPAGTALTFIDIGDGDHETLQMSALTFGGSTGPWMQEIDFSIGAGGRDQQTPVYRGANTYDVGIPPEGPVFATRSSEYVWMLTTEDLTSMEITGTQGPGGGSHGFKIMAPVIPEPSTACLFVLGLLMFTRRNRS